MTEDIVRPVSEYPVQRFASSACIAYNANPFVGENAPRSAAGAARLRQTDCENSSYSIDFGRVIDECQFPRRSLHCAESIRQQEQIVPVIAMTREMGSLGRDVAEGLAKELKLKLIYHEIVDSLVEKMHMPQSAVLRCLQGKPKLFERLRVDMDVLSLYTAEEVFHLATQGNLMIRGWGATYLLRPVSHVVCVRLCAPIELRAKRIMERMGIDDPAIALEEVRRNDSAHASAMQRRFGVNWEDPVHYDVVLNTGRFSVADCIDQIKDLLGRPAFQETPQSRAHLLNLALCAHVSAALKNNPETSRVRISVGAENNAEAGHLVLRGIVLHDAEKHLVEALASRVPGVRLVENQLRLMTPRFVLDVHDG